MGNQPSTYTDYSPSANYDNLPTNDHDEDPIDLTNVKLMVDNSIKVIHVGNDKFCMDGKVEYTEIKTVKYIGTWRYDKNIYRSTVYSDGRVEMKPYRAIIEGEWIIFANVYAFPDSAKGRELYVHWDDLDRKIMNWIEALCRQDEKEVVTSAMVKYKITNGQRVYNRKRSTVNKV